MTITSRIPSVSRPSVSRSGDAPALGGLFAASIEMLVRAVMNRRAIRPLDEMPDHLLKDIGLTRGDVAEALSSDWREDPSLRLAMSASRRRHRINR